MVVEGPIAVIPKEQRGGAVKKRIQSTYRGGLNDDGLIFATAIIDRGIGVVVGGQRIGTAAHLRQTALRHDCEKTEKRIECAHQGQYPKQLPFFHTAKIHFFDIDPWLLEKLASITYNP